MYSNSFWAESIFPLITWSAVPLVCFLNYSILEVDLVSWSSNIKRYFYYGALLLLLLAKPNNYIALLQQIRMQNARKR